MISVYFMHDTFEHQAPRDSGMIFSSPECSLSEVKAGFQCKPIPSLAPAPLPVYICQIWLLAAPPHQVGHTM